VDGDVWSGDATSAKSKERIMFGKSGATLQEVLVLNKRLTEDNAMLQSQVTACRWACARACEFAQAGAP
jgi:hypothetical protein